MEESADLQERPQEESDQKARVHDLFEWRSMNRPSQQYPKEVFATFGAIALLISVILLFFQEWLAIVVTWAAFFLFYALTKIEPVEVGHKITTEGIVSMDHSYLWTELGPFWFSEKGKDMVLHVAHRNILGQLMLLVERKDQERVKNILAEYLPFIELPEKSIVEKLTDWFAKKFPITLKQKTEQPPLAS